MKRIVIIILLFSLAFVSCDQTKKTDNTITSPLKERESEKEEAVHKASNINNDWIEDISLDNGAKWNANIETTKGINAMLNIMNESNLKTVEDYHALANKLHHEKNMIVKECTMKGPSHENLHVFLFPLIEKIDHLLTVTSKKDGSEIAASIKENLDAYKNYFQ